MTTYAEFARTKGAKDKGKRKRRGAMIAGGATALAGAGYGASIPLRAAMGRGYARTDRGDYPGNKGLPIKERARNIANRTQANMGAVVASDRATVGRSASKVNDARKGLQSAVAGSRAGRGISGGLAKANDARKGLQSALAGSSRMTKVGLGALGAGATGAAGIMAYLNAKKKAKKSKSLRGRISSAMGRK